MSKWFDANGTDIDAYPERAFQGGVYERRRDEKRHDQDRRTQRPGDPALPEGRAVAMAEKPLTKAEVEVAIRIIATVGEAIRDLGEVPSGELYARLMGHMSLGTYESIIVRLVGAGLVKRDGNHLLRWVGPAKETK